MSEITPAHGTSVVALQAGTNAILGKLKLNPPLNAKDHMPDSFCDLSAQVSGLAISQCTSFIKELLYVRECSNL